MKQTFRGDDGFTLVELLVSLALLSLMAIYALAAINNLKGMNQIAERTSAQMEVDAVIRHLRESIGAALHVLVRKGDGAESLSFSGKPQSLSYAAASTGLTEVGGVYMIQLSVDDEHQLVERRALQRGVRPIPPTEVVLLRGVDGITFAYHGASSLAPKSEWASSESLPMAVTLSLHFMKDDHRGSATAVVPIQSAQ
jgi:general secretion pathway protein J